jgi:hypothetical protein
MTRNMFHHDVIAKQVSVSGHRLTSSVLRFIAAVREKLDNSPESRSGSRAAQRVIHQICIKRYTAPRPVISEPFPHKWLFTTQLWQPASYSLTHEDDEMTRYVTHEVVPINACQQLVSHTIALTPHQAHFPPCSHILCRFTGWMSSPIPG